MCCCKISWWKITFRGCFIVGRVPSTNFLLSCILNVITSFVNISYRPYFVRICKFKQIYLLLNICFNYFFVSFFVFKYFFKNVKNKNVFMAHILQSVMVKPFFHNINQCTIKNNWYQTTLNDIHIDAHIRLWDTVWHITTYIATIKRRYIGHYGDIDWFNNINFLIVSIKAI